MFYLSLYGVCAIVRTDACIGFTSLLSFSFMMVLVCLIFSVLSTIDLYTKFANETLFWMVG